MSTKKNCRLEFYDIAEFLLQNRTSTSEGGGLAPPAIYAAAMNGYEKIISLLKRYGSAPLTHYSGTPLHIASLKKHVDCIETICELFPEIKDEKNRGDKTPLWYACEYQCLESVKALLKHGASVNIKCQNLLPIEIAQKKGFTAGLELLRQYTASF